MSDSSVTSVHHMLSGPRPQIPHLHMIYLFFFCCSVSRLYGYIFSRSLRYNILEFVFVQFLRVVLPQPSVSEFGEPHPLVWSGDVGGSGPGGEGHCCKCYQHYQSSAGWGQGNAFIVIISSLAFFFFFNTYLAHPNLRFSTLCSVKWCGTGTNGIVCGFLQELVKLVLEKQQLPSPTSPTAKSVPSVISSERWRMPTLYRLVYNASAYI